MCAAVNIGLIVFVCTHRFSVVLKSNRELTDEMFRGRLPSPSSVSSSDFFLLFTHTGKYINFSWRRDTDRQDREMCKMSAKCWVSEILNATKVLSQCGRTIFHGRGHYFWEFLNNAFLYQRKLLVLLFFSPFKNNTHTDIKEHNAKCRPQQKICLLAYVKAKQNINYIGDVCMEKSIQLKSVLVLNA